MTSYSNTIMVIAKNKGRQTWDCLTFLERDALMTRIGDARFRLSRIPGRDPRRVFFEIIAGIPDDHKSSELVERIFHGCDSGQGLFACIFMCSSHRLICFWEAVDEWLRESTNEYNRSGWIDHANKLLSKLPSCEEQLNEELPDPDYQCVRKL